MKQSAALLAGILFGIGLVVSGMAEPENVLAFLVLGSQWNPSLLFVMGSGLLITGIGYVLVTKRDTPIWGDQFRIPTNVQIDTRLLGGAALFGVGWGLSGYCPVGLVAYEFVGAPRMQNPLNGNAEG